MQYKIQNTTSFSDGSAKTIWVDGDTGWSSIPFGPGDIISVSDTGKDQLLYAFPGIVTVLGPDFEKCAPIEQTISVTSSWVLTDLAKYCTDFKVKATAADTLISFTGWDDPATAPPTAYQITVPTDQWLEFSMNMNPAKSVYVKGTSGSLYIIGV